MIEYLGNTDLLNREKVAFLAPTKVEPLSVLPTLDWATEMARTGQVVVSGFSSRLEREVWKVLARGCSPSVMVLVRHKYKIIPMELRPLLDEGRLLIVFLEIASRLDRKTAPRRNAYVASLASEIVFPYVPLQSSLYPIYNTALSEGKTILILRE